MNLEADDGLERTWVVADAQDGTDSGSAKSTSVAASSQLSAVTLSWFRRKLEGVDEFAARPA